MPVTAPYWPGSGKRAVLLVDVPRLRRRKALALVMRDGLADVGTLRPAQRDSS